MILDILFALVELVIFITIAALVWDVGVMPGDRGVKHPARDPYHPGRHGQLNHKEIDKCLTK